MQKTLPTTMYAAEKLAAKLKANVEKLLDSLMREDSPVTSNPKCGKVNFVILDRHYDLLTPILHDFHYQPLIFDVLNLRNDYIMLDVK